jgi:hypothetical protein
MEPVRMIERPRKSRLGRRGSLAAPPSVAPEAEFGAGAAPGAPALLRAPDPSIEGATSCLLASDGATGATESEPVVEGG